MRRLGLVVVLALVATMSLNAQGPQPTQPTKEQPPVPPELMVAPLAPKIEAEPPINHAGSPANMCQELVAFAERRASAKAEPPGAPPPHAGQPGSQPPSGPPAIDKPQHSSGLVAPIPHGETAAKLPLITVEQARLHAGANDVRACQEATKQMRRAGVLLPDPLIALAALRLDLLEAGQASR